MDVVYRTESSAIFIGLGSSKWNNGLSSSWSVQIWITLSSHEMLSWVLKQKWSLTVWMVLLNQQSKIEDARNIGE